MITTWIGSYIPTFGHDLHVIVVDCQSSSFTSMYTHEEQGPELTYAKLNNVATLMKILLAGAHSIVVLRRTIYRLGRRRVLRLGIRIGDGCVRRC